MKYIFSIALFLSCLCSHSQVKFEKIGLNEALEKALASGKIVFAQFESQNCEECNEVANRGFDDPELGKIVAQRCVAIKIDVQSNDRAEFTRRFPAVATMGTYFILGSGELLHRYTRTTSRASAYVTEIEVAFTKCRKGW